MNWGPDKQFEDMQAVGNIHGNDPTQGIETHSEISTKKKPPGWPVLRSCAEMAEDIVECLQRAGEKTGQQESEGDCLITCQRIPGLQRRGGGRGAASTALNLGKAKDKGPGVGLSHSEWKTQSTGSCGASELSQQ